MTEIGFVQHGRHFSHPETNYFVEFLPGPLSIGAEPVIEIDEVHLETGILTVLSVTDCVKDRLAAYFHWGDLQALEQAKLVASQKSINLDEVERWSNVEGKSEEFAQIKEMLK